MESNNNGPRRSVALAFIAATTAGAVYLLGEWTLQAGFGIRTAPRSYVDRRLIALPFMLWPTLAVGLFWLLSRSGSLTRTPTHRLFVAGWTAAAVFAVFALLGGPSALFAAGVLAVGVALARLPTDWSRVAARWYPPLAAAGAWFAFPFASPAMFGSWIGGQRGVEETGADVRAQRVITWTFVALAVVARLIFWVATDRVWEDALITIRHAENAAHGLGLTHHPAHGRVHGFTSAINVLIPLAGELTIPGSGLLALRLTAVAAAGGAVWLAGRIGERIKLSTPALTFWLAYIALEHSQISFGIAGMETEIWLLVLLWGLWAHAFGGPIQLGLACAAAAYCRPDSVIWIGMLLGARCWKSLRQAVIAATIAAACIAPWLAWTTAYYGSPVPNTVRAKACYRRADPRDPQTRFGLLFVAAKTSLSWERINSALPPSFRGHGLWAIPIVPRSMYIGAALTFFGAAGAVRLMLGPLWLAPCYLAYLCFYFLALVGWVFHWYVVPPLALAALLVATGIDAAIRLPNDRATRRLRWLAAGMLVAAYTLPLPATFLAERQVQRVVETGVRAAVGVWLKEHSRPSDYVVAECLGYFGYYSDLPFHDYPGLCSPRAVAALEADPLDRYLAPIVEQLRPEWVVLRDFDSTAALDEYEEVHRIELTDQNWHELQRYLRFPSIDVRFVIYRRRDLAKSRSASLPIQRAQDISDSAKR